MTTITQPRTRRAEQSADDLRPARRTDTGHAQLDGDRLHVTGFVTADPDVLAGARRHAAQTGSPDVTGYVHTALTVGAKALAVVGTSVDLAALDRSVQGLAGDVSRSTGAALAQLATAVSAATDSQTGSIPTTIARALTELTNRVSGLMAGEDAPIRAAVTDSVRAVTDQVLAEVQRAVAAQSDAVRRAVAADAPGSPLHRLREDLVGGLRESHRRLTEQVADLRTALDVDKARADLTAKTPAHGFTYETDVLAALEAAVVYPAGDSLASTGTTPGATPRALTGDAVIDLCPNPAAPGRTARIVVEAKDRDRRASPAAWAELLDKARSNRGAVAALGLVRRVEQMPGGPRRLHVLNPTSYIVAYDPSAGDDPALVTAAYLLLKAHAWAAVLEDHGEHEIDLAALRAGLADSLEALAGFDSLTKTTAGARKQLDELDKTTTSLRASLRNRLEATLRLLDPTTGRPTATPAA
jgi:hypothetical protein